MRAFELPWRVLGSRALSAALGLLLASTAVIATMVPQGTEAMAIAREAHATDLQTLAAWGLTDVYDSGWFRALLALIGGNVAVVLINALMARRSAIALAPPARPAVVHDVVTPRPEHALELARAVLSSQLGPPVAEAAEGSRARMVFDVGRAAHLGPPLAHAGLMLMVLGAGLYASREDRGIPRAVLDITHPASKYTGRFDIVAGETFTFFQDTTKYVLREYLPSREGLGAAVRLERTAEGDSARDVWVYARAPRGFDGRHREGEVTIDAVSMGLSPVPGRALSGSLMATVMLGGLAMVVLGIGASRRSRGRVWSEVEGDRIVIAGVPERSDDRAFALEVEATKKILERAIAE